MVLVGGRVPVAYGGVFLGRLVFGLVRSGVMAVACGGVAVAMGSRRRGPGSIAQGS